MVGKDARGLFITFEGPEGAGKTTQLSRLAKRVAAEGRSVTVTREPGGTPAGERIRDVLLDPEGGGIRPETESLLFCAARSELVSTVVTPALEEGGVVLCDRYADATLAYQGYGRGVPLAWLRQLNEVATAGLVPDLTVLLDIAVDAGLTRRRRSADEWNRLDAAGLAFHQRVREGYHALARAEPERWTVVPADGSVDAVSEAVWRAVKGRLATTASGG